jgi:amidohydrolase
MPPLDTIIRLRRELHQYPEISGRETKTAERLENYFRRLEPDAVLTNLGGHGLAFVFAGSRPGPTVMLRSELDALPIQETGGAAYRSKLPGISHACGHDGHMAIVAAVGLALAQKRPARGRAVLLFQPAEETGQGASAVIGDQRFTAIRPDFVFAFHNLPGFPLGTVVERPGTFSCASCGMVVTLQGRTAHAAQPETGNSPAGALCRVIDAFGKMPAGSERPHEDTFVTVVGARLGAADAFGTAPGQAEVRATLRSASDAAMQRLVAAAENTVTAIAAGDGLECDIGYQDIFPATVNNPEAAAAIRRAVGAEAVQTVERPFRWSEDFGHFTRLAKGALFGIGAGEAVPNLHNPDYDFPEALIPRGQAVFLNILHQFLG